MMPLPVGRWPAPARTLEAASGLWLAALATTPSAQRTSARQALRAALSMLLTDAFNVAPALIHLQDAPGTPLRLAPPLDGIGLSFSHEIGLSVLAVHRDGPVGVDLIALANVPQDAGERQRLACDYLSPADHPACRDGAPDGGVARFAAAWTAREAALKCRGRGLAEWPTAADAAIGLDITPLVLPAGYVGSLARAR